MFVGSLKAKNAKNVNFSRTKDPLKSLRAYPSYNEDKNNEQNLFNKIRKIKTKLNLWLTQN